jgi:hypothetical protein
MKDGDLSGGLSVDLVALTCFISFFVLFVVVSRPHAQLALPGAAAARRVVLARAGGAGLTRESGRAPARASTRCR